MDTICRSYGREGIAKALNANVYGNGTQALVLAHGFGSDQTEWHYLVPYFAYFFKVVVFDMVFSANVNPKFYDPNKYSNFNEYAQDLVCLLDQLNVNNSIYMGHSMSAMIGCLAATKRPELFHHLILLSGSPRYLNTAGYNGGFERWEVDEIFKEMGENFTSWVQSFVPSAIGVNSTSAISEFGHSLGRMNPKIALSVAKTVFLSDLRTLLPQVLHPSTIIQSEKDRIVPESVAFYMKSKLGGHANVNILKTQGHLPQLTAYPLLLEVLKSVLHINK
ncbi:hypothetical protein FEM48_Zijuj12G0080100 [Ziziphus jujuba var. spinosa]|uniref:AB hydrolase-1 domain-containing protein n=1 Tax=Ziziphus jujuba var. spinosa TaxID=714518 RepID=A0A978UC45_ZIZJJ|nr:hypothetical protein FEM48_Zijuj12G0080100 [Ziziphus jujuba var. spinosa]